MKRSKKYNAAVAKIEQDRIYSPLEAVRLLRELVDTKFDQTVETHIRLGVDPRKADQQVRGTVGLPHGTGRTVRVAVFAQGEKAREAEAAGADVVGAQDLAEKVEKGWFEFDVAIATPDMMSAVGKLGKLLGPRGLMPNPKAGTVTFDVAKAVKDVKAGKVEYRVDKFGIVHSVIGKASFQVEQLIENYQALLEEIVRAKPAAAKGKYIKSISFAGTMTPGIKVDTMKTRDLMEEDVTTA
ncbi:MAG: 50S ribosomal protein L1 [Candidatus Aquicultor primus]|uniref:Large ribosomal subunit protein uL1 n=1 Tax=Candidatus Aquicultor primus TaxID=1797195 RepID=A0A1F2UHJ6_9ACTN|nr:MAG: 50S ribosomal protein L1 [Candidatus Aquicultor primus]HCG99994.1 50S ribosomal protein L1 [Actinomycetota bacterium]